MGRLGLWLGDVLCCRILRGWLEAWRFRLHLVLLRSFWFFLVRLFPCLNFGEDLHTVIRRRSVSRKPSSVARFLRISRSFDRLIRMVRAFLEIG